MDDHLKVLREAAEELRNAMEDGSYRPSVDWAERIAAIEDALDATTPSRRLARARRRR